jgi:hypothetical protein
VRPHPKQISREKLSHPLTTANANHRPPFVIPTEVEGSAVRPHPKQISTENPYPSPATSQPRTRLNPQNPGLKIETWATRLL